MCTYILDTIVLIFTDKVVLILGFLCRYVVQNRFHLLTVVLITAGNGVCLFTGGGYQRCQVPFRGVYVQGVGAHPWLVTPSGGHRMYSRQAESICSDL